MRVVSVVPAKQHLYCVSFDDGQLREIDKTVWEYSALTVGSELSESERDALFDRSCAFRAREKALYYLSGRDYGSGELRQKLCRAGIDRFLAEETVQRLCECGLINDARYASILARDMQERKLYPNRRIRMVLQEKGFSRDIVDAALAELPDTEVEQALALLRKKRYTPAADVKQREKAFGMLSRYGFSYRVSARAWSCLEQEEEEE